MLIKQCLCNHKASCPCHLSGWHFGLTNSILNSSRKTSLIDPQCRPSVLCGGDSHQHHWQLLLGACSTNTRANLGWSNINHSFQGITSAIFANSIWSVNEFEIINSQRNFLEGMSGFIKTLCLLMAYIYRHSDDQVQDMYTDGTLRWKIKCEVWWIQQLPLGLVLHVLHPWNSSHFTSDVHIHYKSFIPQECHKESLVRQRPSNLVWHLKAAACILR